MNGQAPPTPKQLRYLRQLAHHAGQTFATPRTRAEASREIQRLKTARSSGFTFAELNAEDRARERHGDAAMIRPWETSGYGSSATWSQRS